jgi:hypothetical protein
VDTEVGAPFWGDESVPAVRVSHGAPGCDARHRVHICVPVEKKVRSLYLSCCSAFSTWRFVLLRNVPPVHKLEGAFVDALEFHLIDLGGGVPRGGTVEHERLDHGLLDAWGAVVQVARREREHFGRFAARDVSVRVPPQVAADVNAEDALGGAVLKDGTAGVYLTYIFSLAF